MLASCGSENSQPEATPPSVTGSSIEENSVIEADAVSSITLTFSEDIEVVNPSHSVLVNESASRRTPLEEGHAAGKTWTIPVSLDFDSHYTLTVTGTSVKAKASGIFAKPYTLKFSTAPRKMPDIVSSDIEPLVNPNATAMAKKVHEFLKENYGKYQLSGAMGEVAWGSEFCDLIYKAAGKYPAIIGFDFIHIPYSPSNWIDYSDISPVRDAWANGSIPAMTWHWNVPTSKDEGSISFNASSSEFRASNVLVEGTWENQVALADVEKVAGYLKLLQDADIPILWRPFHEAAGDYKWGAWFWWGNSGVETTKKLWNWLREKLEKEYGLNNLIWVWTVQTSDEGKTANMSKIREAYPGNDVVDIVGTDLYLEPFANSSTNFNILFDLVEGKKIVALSECGNLLDVDSALSDGALWSYFMGWYDMPDGVFGFKTWNTRGEWKTIMDNPYVLNRGDFNLLK